MKVSFKDAYGEEIQVPEKYHIKDITDGYLEYNIEDGYDEYYDPFPELGEHGSIRRVLDEIESLEEFNVMGDMGPYMQELIEYNIGKSLPHIKMATYISENAKSHYIYVYIFSDKRAKSDHGLCLSLGEFNPKYLGSLMNNHGLMFFKMFKVPKGAKLKPMHLLKIITICNYCIADEIMYVEIAPPKDRFK